jgi:uncharacterized membrane protein
MSDWFDPQFSTLLREGAFTLALIVDLFAVLIILLAVVRAGWQLLIDAFHGETQHPWYTVRVELARWLALSLEFMLAGDIIRTAVAPSWEELGRLAALALIRTALNFVLHLELRGDVPVDPGTRDGRGTPPAG